MMMMKKKSDAKIYISPAETIADNLDLLTQILLRVPATPLLKFKCVSKQWLSLISNPQFCLSHTRLHQNPNSTPAALFLDNRFSTLSKFKVVPLKNDVVLPKFSANLNDGSRLLIEQSCNGLLLCASRVWYESSDVATVINDDSCVLEENNQALRYLICNPTTKKFKRVTFPSMDFRISVVSLNLAFDPSKSPHYKLISIRTLNPQEERYRIDMYSSKTDSWSLLGINFHIVDDYLLCFSAIYCNGSVHWPPSVNSKTMLYFDVETERLKEMPKLPSYDGDGVMGDILYFGESNGHLFLVMGSYTSTPSPSVSEFDVLEMAMDYSEWLVRYHVNVDSIKEAFPNLGWDAASISYGGGFSVLTVVCADNEDSKVVLCVGGVALAYDLNHNRTTKLCDLESHTNMTCCILFINYKWYHVFRYFDSLFCV